MQDRDLAKILPEWATWKKAKHDKIWKEYQTFAFSSKPEDEKEFKRLAEEADILERERFIQQVPQVLDARDHISLLRLLDESFNFTEQDDDPATEKKLDALARDLWYAGASSIVNSLDSRDPLLGMQQLEIIKRLVESNGRALQTLRKCKKLVPWLKFCMTDQKFLAVAPMQVRVYNITSYILVGCRQSYLDEFLSHDLHKIMFAKMRQCCSSEITAVGWSIETLAKVTAKHYPNLYKDESNRALFTAFQVGNHIAADRCLQFDLTKEKFRGHMKMEVWTDVGEIAGAFANLFMAIQNYIRIPTPINVREHLYTFGRHYSDLEPTDDLERSRWSNRYFCMRVHEVDFSSEEGQREGAELRMSLDMKDGMIEQKRIDSIQCGHCKKVEDENAPFSKCGRCKMAFYCSRECQNSHWKFHKKTCRKPAKESLPGPLLTLDESVDQAHAQATRHGSAVYPTIFGVWLYHKYGSEGTLPT